MWGRPLIRHPNIVRRGHSDHASKHPQSTCRRDLGALFPALIVRTTSSPQSITSFPRPCQSVVSCIQTRQLMTLETRAIAESSRASPRLPRKLLHVDPPPHDTSPLPTSSECTVIENGVQFLCARLAATSFIPPPLRS
jgi:hypothetical protein